MTLTRGASPSICVSSATERILEAVGNDVVVHRQPINIRIVMIIRARRHADEQGIFSAAVLMRVINAGRNDHQIAIEGGSEYLVDETVRGRIHTGVVKD